LNTLSPVDILFVEDNPHDTELTLRALKKHKVTERCLGFSDGTEALDYLLRRGRYAQRTDTWFPKVILLDLQLPKLSGLEVLKEIKKDTRTHSIPVVMVTSSGQEEDIKLAYSFGVNSYVVKPVDFNSFTEVISALSHYWLRTNKTPL
jgi:two-component system, response regulator